MQEDIQNILILPGDGIGPEITAAAENVLLAVRDRYGLNLRCKHGLIGGAAVEETGRPLPEETLALAKDSAAVLLGAVGGPQWDTLARADRPEKGLLALRMELGLFANLRPVRLYRELAAASSLRLKNIRGLDLVIVRELTGGLYFGEPRGIQELETGERQGVNTLVYRESEIRRVARVAFEVASKRSRHVCSVDKANVLESMELWREVVSDTAMAHPEIVLSHMYMDNAAMQLVRHPRQFDVLLTSNMFGDILSDLASMLTGSIGMLPSASLDEKGFGLYEPIHGSAPDIAGRNLANPLAAILSVALLLRYSLEQEEAAVTVEQAVRKVLKSGLRTADIHTAGTQKVGTRELGEAVLKHISET